GAGGPGDRIARARPTWPAAPSGARFRRLPCPRTAPRPAANWESDSSTRLPTHQSPTGFLEVRHNVAAAPLAVPSLRRRPLMDSATIHIPAAEDHDVLALADKFRVVI